jgi:hypothetical protein
VTSDSNTASRVRDNAMVSLDHVAEFEFPAQRQYVREPELMDSVSLFEKPIERRSENSKLPVRNLEVSPQSIFDRAALSGSR